MISQIAEQLVWLPSVLSTGYDSPYPVFANMLLRTKKGRMYWGLSKQRTN